VGHAVRLLLSSEDTASHLVRLPELQVEVRRGGLAVDRAQSKTAASERQTYHASSVLRRRVRVMSLLALLVSDDQARRTERKPLPFDLALGTLDEASRTFVAHAVR
jgi:hypothetical protein